jgi:hypothetical protein
LTANLPAPYYADTQYWELVSGNATFIDPTTGFTMNVSNLAPGNNIFRWSIQRGICPASQDLITITNNEVNANAGIDNTICSDAAFLNATNPLINYPFQGVGYWTNLSGNAALISNSLAENSAISSLPIGTTSFQWTVELGNCTDNDVVQITNSSVTASATNQTDCNSTFTLNGNDPSTFGATGFWDIVAGSGTITAPSTQFNTTITGVADGSSTTLQWTVDNGTCTDDIQVSVTNNNFTVSAGPGQTICTDNTIMNADDPLAGTGFWTLLAGSGLFTNSTDRNTTITGIGQGSSVYTWTVTRNGCTNSNNVTVLNNSPSAAFITGPVNTETCNGTATLTSNLPAPYYADTQYWELVSGNATFIDPTTGFTMNVSNLAPGNNIFRWSIVRGTCPASVDLITITNNEVNANAGIDNTVCSDAAFLNATNPLINYPFQGVGYWTNLSGNAALISNSLAENSAISSLPIGTTSFQWTVELGSCTDNDIVQITNSSVTATATNQTDCNSTFTLNGNDPSTFGATGFWDIVAGTGTITAPSTQFNTTITGVSNGSSTTLVWTVDNGTCTDDIQVSVTNNNFSVSAGPDVTICADNTIMNGDDPLTGSGTWTLLAGSGFFTNSTDRNTTITGIGQGSSIYTWTVTRNGCTSFDDVTVLNNSPSAAFITGPVNTETCNGTATLTSNLPAPYYADTQYWELVSGNATFIDPTTGFTMNVSNLAPGNNIFRWSIVRGTCPASVDLITITNNEVNANAGLDNTICTDAAFLNATDPLINYPFQGVGYWTNLSGNSAIISNTLAVNSAITNLPIGTTSFQWTVELGSCTDNDIVQITNSSVSATASNQTDCNSTFTLNGNDPSTFGATGFWDIVAGTGTITAPSTQFNTTITGVSNGSSTTLVWTVDNGTCTDDIQVSVTNNNFSVSAGPDASICADNTIMNADDPLTGNGFWTLLAGSGVFTNSTDRNTTITNIGQGSSIYTWTVTRNGCTSFDDVTVVNNSPSAAFITGPVNTETCNGTATLTANLPAPYFADTQYWELVSGNATFIDPTTGFTMNVSNLAPGNNIFRWSIERGICPASVDLITITNNEVNANAGLDNTICTDATFLNATDPLINYPFQGVGYWTNLSGNAAVVTNSLAENSGVTTIPIGTTSFQWTVELGSCVDNDIVQITNSSVTATASNQTDCNSTFTLNGNDPSTFGATGFWDIVAGTGTITAPSTQFNTTITGIANGSSTTLVWTVDNGTCTDDIQVSVTNNNFSVSAGPDVTICADNTIMNADDPLTGTGTWTLLAGSGAFTNSTDQNTTITGISQGSSIYTWTVTRNGCTSFDDVTVLNNSPSAAFINGPVNTETCNGTATLTANLPAPYFADTQYWELVSGNATFIDPTTGFTMNVSNLAPGNNIFRWSIERGTCPASVDLITITNNEVNANAGGDATICTDAAFLNATDPLINYPFQGVGYWTNLSGNSAILSNSLSINSAVSNLPIGTTSFEWTVELGSCADNDIVQITNSSVTASASNQTDCNSTFTLNGNDPSTFAGTGYWEIVAGTGTITAPSTQFNTTITGVSNGSSTTLRWNVTNGTCSNNTQISVTNNSFSISAGPDHSICTDNTIMNADDPLTGSGFWTLLAGSGLFTNSTDRNTTITNIGQGNSIYTWTVTRNGCTSSDNITVVNNSPSAAFITGPINTETCNGTTTLTANLPAPYFADTQYWELVSGNATFIDPTTGFTMNVSNLAPGNNIFRWSIERSTCPASEDLITITNNEVDANAGLDQSVCVNSIFLNATDPTINYPFQGVGNWTNLSGNAAVITNSLSENSEVTGLPNGTTSFQWTVDLGSCSNIDIVQVSNNSVLATAADQTDCNSSFTLNGNDPSTFGGTGYWQIVAGTGTITAPSTQYNTSITGVNNGSATTLMWTVDNGLCSDDIQISVTNNNFNVSAGPTQNICTDNTIMNADDPLTGTGFWTLLAGSGAFTNSTNRNTTITGISQGSSIYTWTVTRNGCTSSNNVTVTNNAPSTALITGPVVTETCDGTATLTANLPAPYFADTQYWELVSGTATFVDPTAGFTMNVNSMSPGNNIFRWVVSRTGCPPSEDLITITNSEVNSIAGIDQSTCTNSAFLNATDPTLNTPFQGTGYWTNLSGNAAVIANSLSVSSGVTGLPNGTTSFQWTVELGSCTDNDIVQITNNSVIATATSQTGCNSTFTLNGNDPSTFAGTGYWEVVAGSGAITAPSTLYNTTITGVPNGSSTTLRWNVSNALCSNSTQISVTNESFSVSAGPDHSVCTDNTIMNGDDPLSGTGYWTLLAGSGLFTNSTDRNTTVTGIGQGSSIYTWTVTRGVCTSSDNITVTNNSPSTAFITGPVITETCDGTTTLTANLPAPYYADTQYWELVSGNVTFIDPTTGFTMNTSNLAPGNNIFRWVVSRTGCPPTTDMITITNNIVDALAGVDQSSCSSNAFLNASDPALNTPFQGVGFWTNLSGNAAVIANSLQTNSSVTGLPNGTTSFQWTVELGSCSDNDIVQISNNSVLATATNQNGCSSTFTLNGNDPTTFGGTGYWEVVAGTGAITAPSTLYNTTVTGIPNGSSTTLRWNVSNALCSNSIQVSVTNDSFSVSAGPDNTICTDNTIMNADDPLSGTGYWTLLAGSGAFTNSTNRNTTITGIGQGSSIYTWTVTRGACTSSDNVTVTNNSPSTAFITGPVITETCDGTTTLTANLPAPYYADTQYWELVSGNVTFIDPTTGFTMNASNLAPGNNIFRWVVSRTGCPTTEDLITITNNEVNAYAGLDQSACTNSAFLNATDPSLNYPFQGVGYWTNLSGNAAVIANSLQVNSSVSNLPNGTTSFQWTVELGSCTDNDVVQVSNNSVLATAANQNGCSSTFTLNGNDPSTFGGTGYWEVVAGLGTITAPSTLYNTSITGIPNGSSTTLRWNVSNGLCTNNVQVSVTNDSFSVSAGPDHSICTDNTIMNGDDPLTGTGYWTLLAGSGVFTNSTLRNTTITGISPGSSIYTWTVTRGACTSSNNVTVTNNSPSTAFITGPVNTETCDGTITLTANLPAPYYADTQYWELVSGNVTFNDPSTNFTVDLSDLAPGNNVFKWVVSRIGCPPSEDQIFILNNQVDAIAGIDQSSCSSNAFLNATDPSINYPFQGVGYWTNLSGNTAVITNSLSENSGVTGLPNGTTSFQWTVELGSCVDNDVVQISNNSVLATAASQIDCNSTFTLNGNDPSTFGGTGYWEIVAGTGTITAPSTLYNTTITGVFNGASTTLRWNVSNGLCTNSTQVSVTNNSFSVSAGPDHTICTDNTMMNADDPLSGTGYWTLLAGSGLFTNSTIRNTTITGIGQGNSVYTWTITRNGCTSSDNITVTNNTPSAAVVTGPLITETCSGTATLTANLPAPLFADANYWTQLGGTSTFIDPSTSFTLNVSNMTPGSNLFRWTISRVGCPASTDDIEIINNIVSAEAGPPQTLCLNTTSLNATSTNAMYPFQGTGAWSTLTPGIVITNSLLETTGVSNIPNGAFTFFWTVSLGSCTFADNVVISNYSVDATATNAQTCDGNVFLTGNTPAPGENGIWSTFTPGVTYDDQTLYNTGAHNLVTGNNTFVWSLNNAFCSDNANIIVEYIDPICNAGPNQAICTNNTYLAGLSPTPGNGVWTVLTGSGTFTNASSNNSFVTNIGVGANVYRWTVNDRGCIETSTVTVTNNLPVSSAGTDLITCLNTAVLPAIQELAGETGLWTKIGGTGVITTPSLYNSPVTNLSAGVNVFEWTVNNGLCSNSDQVQIFNNRITSISAGIDRDICTNTTTLAALPPGAGQTGAWDALSGSAVFTNSNAYNSGVSNLSQGSNSLRWTLSNGTCNANDIVVITNNSPTTPTVSPDDVICSNIYTLLGNPPAVGETGLWTKEFGASGNIVDPTANITIVNSIGQGSNTFRWTITNALCSAHDDIVITNSSISTDAGLDASLCVDTATLSANNPAPGTGAWTIINSGGLPVFDNATMYNTIVRDLGSGPNIFVWTATRGVCSAWDLVTISNDTPTPANAGFDQTVCDGTVVLSGNNPTVGTGIWSRLGGAGTIANPTNYNTNVTGLGSGGNTFRWAVSQGACHSYDDVLILNELVYASAGLNDSICGTSYPELNGNLPGVGENGLWTVSGGTGVFANPTLYNTSVSGLSGGENRLTWTVTRGTCANSADVSIFDNTPSPASVSSDKEICTTFTVISGNPPSTGTGHWEVAAGSGLFDNSLANTTTVRDIGDGINIYRWVISNGSCSSTADIRVTNNSVTSIVGDSIFVCGITAYLNGNEPVAGQTGVWTVTAGTGILIDNTLYNTQVTNLNKGLNKFRWTIGNGTCSDYADLVVTNDLYDANASVAGPTTICTNYADLLANIPVSGATGLWSVWAGGGTFDDPTSPTARITGLLKGDNTLRWTVTKNGCSNWDDVVITNNMVEALAGSDLITCGNDANLVANELFPGENGLWTRLSGAGTIITPSDNQTIVTGLGAGVNVFRWSVTGNGCSAQDEVQVSENTFFTSAGFDQHVCTSTVSLQGQNPAPGNGVWSFSGPGVTIVNPTLNTTLVTGLQDNSPHTFRWTVFKNGCSAWDEVMIYNDLVTARAGADFATCTSNTTLAAENPVAGTGLWTITAGGGVITTPSYYASAITNLGLGSNTLVWFVTNLTCISSDVLILTNNKVTATAGADILTCNNYANLNGDQPQAGGSGQWLTVGGPGIVQTPSAFNTLVTNLQRGFNTFQWTVYQNGCNNGGDLVTVTNNSFDANAGEDQLLAPMVDLTNFEATLEANQTGFWSVLSGSGNIVDINDPNSEVNTLLNGVNTFAWNVSNTFGCTSYDDVAITVANFVPNAGSDQIVCTDSAKLNATWVNGAITQRWSLVSGQGTFDDIYDPKTIVRNILWGANIYRWTVYFTGYSAYDDVVITNDSIFVSAGDDGATCGTEWQMNAQYLDGPTVTHLWTPIGIGGGTIVDNSAWNTMITDLPIGSNVFNWHVDNGNCQSDDIVIIDRMAKPIAGFTTTPSDFCAPDSVLLENTSNFTPGYTEPDEFRWYIEGEYLSTTFNVNEDLWHYFTNTGTEDSTYVINMVAIDIETGCMDTVTHSILARSTPTVAFGLDPHLTRFPDATAEFENLSEEGLLSYLWDFGDGYNEYQTEWIGAVDHTYETWGTYYITLTGTSGGACNGVFTDSIVILPPCPYSYDDPSLIAEGCQPLLVEFTDRVYFTDSIEWKFYGDFMYPDSMTNASNPIYIYTEPGTYYPIIRAWSDGCDQVYERQDTVIVYPKPIADFDITPQQIMIPNQLIHCYNYSEYGVRYLWNFGDGSDPVFDFEPIHQYTQSGVFDISLQVWSNQDCYDSMMVRNAVFAEDSGFVKFPNAFKPNPSGPTGGYYPCLGDMIDTQNLNEIFYPLYYGVAEYHLEIYNRWGEKIYTSDELCKGWDGYVDGVMAPQDVYVWKVSVIYDNGEPYKEYGSLTLLR